MGKVEESIEIKAPPEKVLELLALDRLLECQVGFDKVKSIEYTSELGTPKDKYRVGALLRGYLRNQKTITVVLKS